MAHWPSSLPPQERHFVNICQYTYTKSHYSAAALVECVNSDIWLLLGMVKSGDMFVRVGNQDVIGKPLSILRTMIPGIYYLHDEPPLI